MERRIFLKSAAAGALSLGIASLSFGSDRYYPTNVDPRLFETINRAKNPAMKTPLEKLHVPVIKAPAKVKVGEPFSVDVRVGEILHPMGPDHWIGFTTLSIGNEPAGRVEFQSRGYLKPTAVFHVVLSKEMVPTGRVTLFVYQRCNIHGYWEGTFNIEVV